MAPAGQDDNLLNNLLRDNARWADGVCSRDSTFFEKSAKGQAPHTLWIGCSDSRIPETKLLNAQPGDIFVHRNIANVVKEGDQNMEAVVEFAVAAMKVKQIILCGHTNCGGVAGSFAAVSDKGPGGKVESWLQPLKELIHEHKQTLAKEKEPGKSTKLAELNVQQGVGVLKKNQTVKAAIRDRGMQVHGVLYNLGTGKLSTVEI